MAKRRTYGNTWWGKQWLDALANVDYSNRLPRGRTYCNTGRVISCEWLSQEQCIEALVSGSAYYPYEISIALPQWSRQKERELLNRISQEPAIVADLLEGVLPPAVADICRSIGLELFPSSWRQMKTHCSCPDSARICRHIAAVFYALADQIDADPFLIFKLHGTDLQAEFKERGVDLAAATTARPLTLSQLAHAAVENKPDPRPLSEEDSFEKLRTLPYGTLEPMFETLLALFPESLPTPGDKDFRSDFRRLLTSAAQHIRRIQTVGAAPWPEDPAARLFREKGIDPEALDPRSLTFELQARAGDCRLLGASLQLAARDDAGGVHTVKTTALERIFPLLLQLPADRARECTPQIECWREITQLAARLLENGAVVPALVVPEGSPGALPRVIWTPAVRSPQTAHLMEELTQAALPVLDALFKEKAVSSGPSLARQTIFLAVTLALCALMKEAAGHCRALAGTASMTLLLAMQTPVPAKASIPETVLKGMLRGLRAFLLGDVFPWRPVLTARVHPDGVKLNYGILGRNIDPELAAAEELTGSDEPGKPFSTTRPVMLARLLKEERYQNERFAALSVLKTLTSPCPLLKRIEETGGKPVTLEAGELKEFLFDAAPVLTLLGVAVMLPASLKRLLRPRLVAHLAGAKGRSFLGRDAFSDFNWRVAVGGHELTQEELAELMAHAGGVVRFADNFVYLDPAELERLAKTVAEQPQPTYLEKMRAALTGEYEKNGRSADVLVDQEIRERLQKLTAVEEIAPPENLEAVLRPYQARGFSWLMKNLRLGIGSLIADDMGLGKTLQVIAAVLQLKNDGELAKTKVLAVVPTTLMTNWMREIARFAPSLTVGLYHGANRTLAESVKDLPDVMLTSYGLLRRDLEAFTARKWRLLILDEAQAVKNTASGQSVAAKSVKAAQTIAMTGTPVENRLLEYWSILETVQPKLLGSMKDFQQTFAVPIESDHDAKAAEAFRKLTAPFMLRRLKSDKSIIADLPERNTIDQYTTLTPEQAALYAKVLEAHMKRLAKLEDRAQEDGANDVRMARRGEVLKLITSMKQICNSPSQYLKTAAPRPDSGKAAALFDILERCREAGRKVLIFTQYREMGERLQDWIEAAAGERPDFLHGGVALKARQAMVDRFQTDRSVHTMIISLKAGGTGLNLTAASCVVHYDLWWNPAVEAQATDRAYRIGQRRDVLAYRFVTAGTFEERINDMLAQKRGLADLTVAAGESWIGDLSSDELQQLFALGKTGDA